MIARLFGKRDSRPFLSPGREVRLRAPAKMLLDGETKENLEHSRSRLILAGSFFMAIFATISYRLVDVAVVNGVEEPTRGRTAQTEELRLGRADITDRNGVLLATNLPTVNLFADGRDVRDPEESARALARVLPGLDYAETLQRLSSGQAFVYLKRNLTPKQQFDVNTLGLPGVQFQKGEARVYPQGHILSHTVGMTNVDNQGLSGIELAFDQRLRDNGEPMALSIDLRLQHLVTRELATAIEEFDAVGAAGVVLDARTGEVLALSSLPDFDPHSPPAADDPVLFNRVTKGLYEMGSVFKLFTAAAALETGTADLTTRYDATDPIQVASFTIKDFHPLARPLTVAEIITHSSNIGAAKMGLELGGDAQREFLSKLGILDRASIEVPEISTPRTPSPWRPINTMTISYGHGISVTPLHVVSGVAALVNGGFLRPATLLKSTDGKFVEGRRVLSFDTSRKMRHLMRLVVEEGSGRKAEVSGYMVGGKTGSAEKIDASGHYVQNGIIASFVAAFPMNEPRYIVLTVLDEPKGNKQTYGFTTAGWNAAPVAGRIIEQLAMMSGLAPRYTGTPGESLDGRNAGLTKAVVQGGDLAAQ